MKALAWLGDHPRWTVGAAMLATSLAVYAPFVGKMDRVHRYWDGPAYMYVAKTLYQVPEDHPFVDRGMPASYFANHLPLYPLLIRGGTVLTLGSYPAAMILATLVTAVAAAVLFHELLRSWDLVASPLWTALLFCVLPPRWLIYHAVGATEPLFFALAFGAFLALRAERPGLVALLSGLAALTRITGILLPGVFFLIYLQRRQWRRAALMPAALLGVVALFGYYHWVYGDFFAYFSWSMDQAEMVSFLPFDKLRDFVDQGKLPAIELFVGLYLLYGAGTLALWKRRELFTYAAVYFAFYAFVTHRDMPRYFLTIAPFALLVAFDDVLRRPALRWLVPLVLYVDYAYAWGYIPQNLAARGLYQELLRALTAP